MTGPTRNTRSRNGCSQDRLFLIFMSIAIFVSVWNITFVSKYIVSHRSYRYKENKGDDAHENTSSPPKIAYAISLMKCGDHQSTPAGMLDAATILRHSIHETSIRNPQSHSKYDYEMYVFVHRQAVACARELQYVGYNLVVVDPPLNPKDIRGQFLRDHIGSEWCCGSDEFIKLYAYNLTQHPLVVHLDLDFMMMKPMDTLFDAMLMQGKSQAQLQPLWDQVELQYPEHHDNVVSYAHKNMIEASITRDYPDIPPGYIPGYQAGFIVLRPNSQVIQKYVDIILEGNYVPGFEYRKNGWGGKGYGAFVGAKAMQGIVAYFYDIIQPNTSVELNSCRYNYMGADIIYRPGGKAWMPNKVESHGKCRSNQESCEDCTKTDLNLVYNVHFTVCRKPWTCPSKAFNSRSGGLLNQDLNPHLINLTKNLRGLSTYIDLNLASYEQCMKLHQAWHRYRNDFEDKLYSITHDSDIFLTRNGEFEKEFFMGHCDDIGKYNFMNIYQNQTTLSLLYEVWK